MSSLTKAFIYITPIPGDTLNNRYSRFLYDNETNPDFSIDRLLKWYLDAEIDNNDVHLFTPNGSLFTIEIGSIEKEKIHTSIGEFVDRLTDEYHMNVDVIYSDEKEENCGLWRVVFNLDDEFFSEPKEKNYYAPKDNKQRHELFLMAWNRYRVPRDGDLALNKKGIEDETDLETPPIIEDWIMKFIQNSISG